jgi:ribosomal protein S18 acetylase RimI-like enzyme
MIDEIVFRPLREDDAPQIYQVALVSWKYTYRDIFVSQFIENFINRNYTPKVSIGLLPRVEAGQVYFQVAVSENAVAGFCHIGETLLGMEIFRIYLCPSYIGKGIGGKLLELGEEFISSKGYNTYFCFVHKNNEIGKRFYLKTGFIHVSEKDRADEWYMEKIF